MHKYSAHELVNDFISVAKLAGISILLSEIEIIELHKPRSLPVGKQAIYLFMYDERCLKVGKVGPKSSARYCSQHYGIKARSTLAKSLIKNQSRLGLSDIDTSNVGEWICQNTKRINILIPAKYSVALLSLLESFIQCRLNPEFEGFESQRAYPNILFNTSI